MNLYNRRILEYMKQKKVTQRDIADLLGISQPTVNQRLRSEKTFDVEDLLKICRFLEVKVSDLLYEVTDETGKGQEAAQILSPADLLMISTKRHEEILRTINQQGDETRKSIDALADLIKKALGRQN